MSGTSHLFIERALVFLNQAKAGKYPNAPWLAERLEISEPTAHRVIQTLQLRYRAPIAYSDADRGFYLIKKDWVFPFELCAQEEIEALLVALSMLDEVGDDELEQAGRLLRERVAERFGTTAERLERLLRGFAVERTDRIQPTEPVLLPILDAIEGRSVVELTYDSPWSEASQRRRRLVPLHLRLSDGCLYLRAIEGGERKSFNLAFAKDVKVCESIPASVDEEEEVWNEGCFGVWQGEAMVEVEVRLSPPGSRYFARQRWNRDQRDEWEEGEVLCRRFRALPSPQLLRHLLGLAPWLLDVRPEEVRDMVIAQADDLAKRLITG
jgi:predicted DNA-binding transcriptional regulator YafY